MGTKFGQTQSTASGQMNQNNMQRQALNPRNPYSGYSEASANMPMAYGPTGTEAERNPYMYQLYGSQQSAAPSLNFGSGNYGTVGPQPQQMSQQPFDREAAYNALTNSSLGQKFGLALNPNRGVMNPALGMQSYGVGPYAEDATDYQGMAQTASGVGQNAGGGPAPEPKREMPSFLVPYSRAGINNQPLHPNYSPGLAAYTRMNPYNTVTGNAPTIVTDDKYDNTSLPSMNQRARSFFSGDTLNPYGEEFLYDSATNTLYSPGAAQERFGY